MPLPTSKRKIPQTELDAYNALCDSILAFIEAMWNLVPQPILPKHKTYVLSAIKAGEYDKINSSYFKHFEKNKHITWQQFLILSAIENATLSEGGRSGRSSDRVFPRRISVRSGRGIGKSTIMSWALLWFLFSNYESNVACTAPNQKQMYDVLWKECSKWIGRMPDEFSRLFEWQSSYIRMTEKPHDWFASARTAKKETPEALAGLHSDNSAALIDEASGVPDEVFEVMEGSLTDKEPLILMISNPTRLDGYFFRSQQPNTTAKDRWQRLHFSSLDSPIVHNIAENIALEYGEDSDQYRVSVLGEFPKEDAIDSHGYSQLIFADDIKIIKRSFQDQSDDPEKEFVGRRFLGIDPAGEGKNSTVWTVRDQYRAMVVAEEEKSDPKGIAQKTLTLAHKFNVKDSDIVLDLFGVGALVAKELALSGHNIATINVGDRPDDKRDQELYANKRAQFYFKLKSWLRSGGELFPHKRWEKELTSIRYRRTLSGKLQLMSKKDMRKMGFDSPDVSDSISLTLFLNEDDSSEVRILTPANQLTERTNSEHNYADSLLVKRDALDDKKFEAI